MSTCSESSAGEWLLIVRRISAPSDTNNLLMLALERKVHARRKPTRLRRSSGKGSPAPGGASLGGGGWTFSAPSSGPGLIGDVHNSTAVQWAPKTAS
jgi:hypothetical protein